MAERNINIIKGNRHVCVLRVNWLSQIGADHSMGIYIYFIYLFVLILLWGLWWWLVELRKNEAGESGSSGMVPGNLPQIMEMLHGLERSWWTCRDDLAIHLTFNPPCELLQPVGGSVSVLLTSFCGERALLTVKRARSGVGPTCPTCGPNFCNFADIMIMGVLGVSCGGAVGSVDIVILVASLLRLVAVLNCWVAGLQLIPSGYSGGWGLAISRL